MAYQIFDYKGNLLGEEEDSVIEDRIANSETANDGLHYLYYDVYNDVGEIYNTFSDLGESSAIRVVKKIEAGDGI